MKNELQLQLQAYLDGELSGTEVRAVETRLQEDAAARGLLAELRQTRSVLSGQELLRLVPESREFYWSKIARQIEREVVRPAPIFESSWLRWLRHAFSPVGGSAALLALVVVGFVCYIGLGSPDAIHEAEADQPDAQMLTFRDHQEGMTVVWLSYRE